jgi:hypothetical protein
MLLYKMGVQLMLLHIVDVKLMLLHNVDVQLMLLHNVGDEEQGDSRDEPHDKRAEKRAR